MAEVTVDEDVIRPDVVVDLDEVDQQLVGQLVDRARSQGLRLTGEDGLLGPAHQEDRRNLRPRAR